MDFLSCCKLQNRSVGNEIIRINVTEFVIGSFLFKAGDFLRAFAVFALNESCRRVHSCGNKKINSESVANGLDLKNG